MNGTALHHGLVLFLFLALPAGAASPAAVQTTRQARPWTLAGAANAVMPSIGVELGRQVGDRLGVAVQLTQLLIAHVDLSLRTRFFVVAGKNWGLYVGPNAHLWYSPLILTDISPLVSAEAGYEMRQAAGFTLGLGLGAGIIWENGTKPSGPVPLLNLRIGKSW